MILDDLNLKEFRYNIDVLPSMEIEDIDRFEHGVMLLEETLQD
jgi:hypothetical protein